MTPDDVPPGPVVVDTDVLSTVYAGTGRAAEFTALLGRDRLLTMSFATYAEMLAGANAAQWGPVRVQQLESRLRGLVVLPYDVEVAREWARIFPKVRGHLHGEGVNDCWTAAVALVHALPVVTNNLRDFVSIREQTPELRLVHPDL